MDGVHLGCKITGYNYICIWRFAKHVWYHIGQSEAPIEHAEIELADQMSLARYSLSQFRQ